MIAIIPWSALDDAKGRACFVLSSARAFTALGCAVAMLALVGCSSGGGSSGPAVYPVTGIVKHKGQPVAGADIVFSLKEGTGSSFGRTDASGRYQLTTRRSNDGAPPGDYLVSISKAEAPGQIIESIPPDDPRYNPYTGKGTPIPPPPKSGLPPQYGDAKTSGLTARVNAENNTIDFDLK